MNREMSVEWRIKRLQEDLQKLKDLPEDRKFTCANCGKVYEKRFERARALTLCYNCERKVGKLQAQQKADENLVGAHVVAVEIKDNDDSELFSLSLAKGLKRFKLTVGDWEEHCIDVEETEI